MCTDPSVDDKKYRQALEHYALVCQVSENLRQRCPDAPVSEKEAKTMERAMSLQEDIDMWQWDTPDAVVATEDREDVEKVIDNMCQGPPAWVHGSIPDVLFVSFSSLPADKKSTFSRSPCERTTISFYNGNRCFADLLFYFDAPLAAAGLRIYLFKHEGRWKVCYCSLWRS